MDRLFKRNEEYTKMLIEGAEVCSRKKEQRKFTRYVYTYIEKEYKKSAAGYFSKAATHGYLKTIIDLSRKLEHFSPMQNGEVPNTEFEHQRWELIQALAIGIMKPKLLFKSKGPAKYKTVREFEKMLQKIYREWDDFQKELDLCQHYMQRGTVRLDRPAETDCLTHEREAMADEINKVYQVYYYQLRAFNLCQKREIPTVRKDSNLFLNITEKPWLVPLAHIMLIRDAQFQMMGKEKYKDSALLFGEFNFLNMGELAQEQRKERDRLTVYYALRIRDILAKYLKGRKKTDCRSAFSHYFKKEYTQAQEKAESGIFYKMGIWNPIASMDARVEFMDRMSIFDVPDFSVPSCHVRETALTLAKQLQLTPDQLQKLEAVMPDALWGQKTLEKSLGAFEGDIKGKLVQRLDPLRTLVNAKEYYSGAKTEDAISEKLLSAAAKIYANPSKGTVSRDQDAKMSLSNLCNNEYPDNNENTPVYIGRANIT